MRREILLNSISQLLENYQRCGLSRFVDIPLAEETAAKLTIFEESAADAAEQPLAAEQGKAAGQRSSDVAPQSGAPIATDTQLEAGQDVPTSWTLPVLPVSERESRLADLETQVRDCRKCSSIVDFRQRTVFGEGPLQPRICFMGEAPGADEDRSGRPFVGKAGQLLTKIISAMNISREDVYIMNALKCRPPQNRTPVPEEIEDCRHFAESQLEILQPEYIVCLGAVAVRSILQSSSSIGRLRGRFHNYRGAKVVVTYHPSYLLRNEGAKRLVWDDMKMLMQEAGIQRRDEG